jgi:UDP-N-acetylglucosamine diphosphorylase / glucose-1-phosphate thymidylyltransferase / UDP-N-acetylgalactosamine diphosphorylase / glucosamine-1-phosphate N-acetyltransferase / galactosamine-1-phosphate N-acetyltransferase
MPNSRHSPSARLVIFDDGKGELSPLTDLRPAFDIRTGAMTTLERLKLYLAMIPTALLVPQALHEVARQRFSEPVNPPSGVQGPVLLVSGRCVIPPEGLSQLAPGEVLTDAESGDVIAANVSGADIPRILAGDLGGLKPTPIAGPTLLTRPWHVRRFRDRAISLDLRLLREAAAMSADPDSGESRALFESSSERTGYDEVKDGPRVLGSEGVTIMRGARVYPGAILDCEHGPIFIDRSAIVRPGAILIGPCYVGVASGVLERATIRPNTAIGPSCKVGGEVGGTIFQGFSNKAHDGYLGDSFVGEWVNLGAGTTGSNLLNTYGEIIARATAAGKNERTGEQFLGSIIGDHVKTAICTRLMTGSILHTGGMFATTAPVVGTTRPFAWATDERTQSYRLDKFLEVARAMMARRKVEPTDAYVARLAALHAAAIA